MFKTADSVAISGLVKIFSRGRKTVKALDNVSFSIRKGEIFGLLGPNGAGKTTLISVLCGLLEKNAGRVEILGKNVDRDMSGIQKRINLVLGFTGIGMSLTVYEFLKYYCMLYGLGNKDARIASAMKSVDIEDKRDTITLELSSGYKQRLLLAKALLNEPEVLLLDEPTVGLDVEIAIKIRSLIKELQKKGTAILLTTHNMYEVEELCDRIALISKGRIIALGTVDEIKKMIKVDKVIEVDVDRLADFAGEMKRQKYVVSSRIVDDVVHVKVVSYGNVRKVMDFLSKSDFLIYSVRLVEPTLEEAFLKIMRKDAGGKK
ncbi:MAG: antibiotic transport system ATP-binding protein [archaeon GW2011_AR3]|nr:MAG: antibiotic transport system ATP-binding protein [archaeon GW2011_AR3]MBS3108971.1 ABC transporter ATP-binding protein [Candidatus Woesearchaeota archaeon]